MMSSSSSWDLWSIFCMSARETVLRIPATTSSPWAFWR